MTLWSASIALLICLLVVQERNFAKSTENSSSATPTTLTSDGPTHSPTVPSSVPSSITEPTEGSQSLEGSSSPENGALSTHGSSDPSLRVSGSSSEPNSSDSSADPQVKCSDLTSQPDSGKDNPENSDPKTLLISTDDSSITVSENPDSSSVVFSPSSSDQQQTVISSSDQVVSGAPLAESDGDHDSGHSPQQEMDNVINDIELYTDSKKTTDFYTYTRDGSTGTYIVTGQIYFTKVLEGSCCLCSSAKIIWEASEIDEKAYMVVIDGAKFCHKLEKVDIYLKDGQLKHLAKVGCGLSKKWVETSTELIEIAVPTQKSAPKFNIGVVPIAVKLDSMHPMAIRDLNKQSLHSNIIILTQDPNEPDQMKENDVTQYDLEHSIGDVFRYKMKDNSKCLELKYEGHLVWKYDSNKDPSYPKSLAFYVKTGRVLVRMDTSILKVYAVTETPELLYDGEIKPTEFTNHKSSNDKVEYTKDGNIGTYLTKSPYLFNKIKAPPPGTSGSDVIVWCPDLEYEYSNKVIVDGVKTTKSMENITVFLLNGDIKHFTIQGGCCSKIWVQKSTRLTLDISKKDGTYEYDCIKDDKNKTRTYNTLYNFGINKVVDGEKVIWKTLSSFLVSKTVFLNLGLPTKEVTINLEGQPPKIFVNLHDQWVEKGFVILDIDKKESTHEFSYTRDGNIGTYSASSDFIFSKVLIKKGRLNFFGSDETIWESSGYLYAKKVAMDGRDFFSRRNNIKVFLSDFDVKHYTTRGFFRKWVLKETVLTLDIKKTESKDEYIFSKDFDGNYVYATKYNYSFTSVLFGNEVIWKPDIYLPFNRVTVENYGDVNVEVTVHYSLVTRIVLVKQGDLWIEKGTVSLNIQKQISTREFEFSKDKDGVCSYQTKEDFVFSCIKEGETDIWTSKTVSQNSKKVLLKYTGKSEIHLAVFDHNENFLLFHKSPKEDSWLDITFSSYSFSCIKMYYKDSNSEKEMDDTHYEPFSSGFSHGCKFKDGIKCVRITYSGDSIWEHKDQYPTHLYLDIPKNNLHLKFPGKDLLLDMKEKTTLILSINEKSSTTQYNYTVDSKTGWGIFTPKEGFIFNGVNLKSGSSCRKAEHDIWYPEYQRQYSQKVLIDGTGSVGSTKNVIVYQDDGDIRHFNDTASTGSKWIEKRTKITLNIKKKSSIIDFNYSKGPNVDTYTTTYNFKFVCITESDVLIWNSKNQEDLSSKVEVKDLGKATVQVTVHLDQGKQLNFVKSNSEWVAKGQLILNLNNTASNYEYEYNLDDKIGTFTPSKDSAFKTVKIKDDIIWQTKDPQLFSVKVVADATYGFLDYLIIYHRNETYTVYYRSNKDEKLTDITDKRNNLSYLRIAVEDPEHDHKLIDSHYKVVYQGTSYGYQFKDGLKVVNIRYDKTVWQQAETSKYGYPKALFFDVRSNTYSLLFPNNIYHVVSTKKDPEEITLDISSQKSTYQFDYVKDSKTKISSYISHYGYAFNKVMETKGTFETGGDRDIYSSDKISKYAHRVELESSGTPESPQEASLFLVNGEIEHFIKLKEGRCCSKKFWQSKPNTIILNIRSEKSTHDYEYIKDKETKIVTYKTKYNFFFKTVVDSKLKDQKANVWFHNQMNFSTHVILFGSKKTGFFLSIVLIEGGFQLFLKKDKEWEKITDKIFSFENLKMLAMNDETYQLENIELDGYEPTISGTTYGYKFNDGVKCTHLKYRGKDLWKSTDKNTYLKALQLNMQNNDFQITLSNNSTKKLDVKD